MSENNAFSLISPELTEKLNAQNINLPTKVQETVIPQILDGENIVFQSETGTGKTFAYLLPLLTKLFSDFSDVSEQKSVRILIVAPTFELASQIKQTLSSVAAVKSALFIGGSPIKRQIEALKENLQL